jgi:aminopeptidase
LIDEVIERIYKDSLGIQRGEYILLIADDYPENINDRKDLLKAFENIGSSLDAKIKSYIYEHTKGHGQEPPIDLWCECFGEEFCKKLPFEDIKDKKVGIEFLNNLLSYIHDKTKVPDVIIALSFFSTSHTLFRKFSNMLGCRYASMPMIEKSMFKTALNVDYKLLEKKTLEFKNKIVLYNMVHIGNEKGTDIIVNFKNAPISADTGNLRKAGSFGNLPAGEVFLPPLLEKTTGRINVEFYKGERLSKPSFIYFEDGIVTKVEGDNTFVDSLDRIFEDERNRVIAELGVGTNEMAKNPVNVLEAEKIDGTVHIAIGDNSTFGGNNKASTHIDFVIFNPQLRWFK